MPQLEKLWNQYKDKGLHIFHVESQGADKDTLAQWLEKRNVTFPNVVGRGAFGAYPGDNGLPFSFVIGVDGKVLFQGRGDYKAVIHEEIKKVRFPGLGKASVAKGLEKSAASFAGKKYAKAVEAAKKKLDGSDDQALIADANYIIEKVQKVSERLHARVEKYKGEREYTKALQTLQIISSGFKGTPEGDAAKKSFKSLKGDSEVKKELKAEAALAGIKKKLGTIHDPAKKRALLESFASKYEGLKAAERAKKMIELL